MEALVELYFNEYLLRKNIVKTGIDSKLGIDN